MAKFLFFIIAFLSATQTNAQNNAPQSLNDALLVASEKQLSQKPDWLHLMQYINRVFGSPSSEIKSTNSFFANDGKRNPNNELNATISAMYEPVSLYGSSDDHPRCKFIARYDFLSQYINFPNSINSIECVKFKQWLDLTTLDSISLVFASGYFKNPASFYGHPLLKFNSGNESSSLLDITINNGAIVPPNENPIVYMVKGVFGGYKAAFSDTKFYQINHNYSESDLRDLWEYQLDLTPEQQRRVVHYSWELLRFSTW